MKKESLIKFYQSHRLYIFPAVVALSSLFLILFAIYPQTVKLIENQKKTEELIAKSEFLETKVTALESYDSEDLSRKVGLALAAFPSEKDFGSILGLMLQQTARSGFNINSFSLSNIGGKLGNSDSFDVKLEIKGSRDLFQAFINDIENSSRIVRINSIDISVTQASQTVDASLVLGVLYSQLPSSFGTVDAPLPQISQKDEEQLVALVKASEAVPVQEAVQFSPRGKSNPFE